MNDERQVVAYHNICSHRAAAVATGEGRVPVSDAPAVGSSGLRFECPYHAWQFDLAGRLRGCRISHGLAGIRDFTPETSGLTPIRADVWGPLVFLHWGDNELPPVAEALGAGGAALAAEGVTAEDWVRERRRAPHHCGWVFCAQSDLSLQVHHKRVDYPMACNWKCMTDNCARGQPGRGGG